MDAVWKISTVFFILQLVQGEYCDNGTGECKELTSTDCPAIFYNLGYINAKYIKYCDEINKIVCCPLPLSKQQRKLQPVETRTLFEMECQRYNEIRSSCRTTPLIAGGTKAVGKEFPFMALIGTHPQTNSSNIQWICGGTLIHPKFVLTAAHCLDTEETKAERLDPNFNSLKFVVRLGELDYNSTKDDAAPQDFHLVNYVVHLSYSETDNDKVIHDIALLELDRSATLNEYVSPACLPPSSGNEHFDLVAAGWGITKDAGNQSSHLLKTFLRRVSSDETCGKRLESKIVSRTQFCADSGSSTSVADTCSGDSGGPIFVQHPRYNCLKQIIGVTSYGLACGLQGFPSVYTKVHLYTDWIEKIVWAEYGK